MQGIFVFVLKGTIFAMNEKAYDNIWNVVV